MYRRVRVVLTAVGAAFFLAEADGSQGLGGLRLTIRTDKMHRVLGEPVILDIHVLNPSPTPALIPEGADVWVGHLHVLIAFEDDGYKEYRGPGWGLKDIAGLGSFTIPPGQLYTTQATVLYNHGVETAHLNARSAREITQRFLETGYALATPGRYRIKARLYDHQFKSSIESAPIEIDVGEPSGVDRDVWEVLKTDPDYGYFIQSGGPRGHPADPRNVRMMETLEKIANDRPLSRYTAAIHRSLTSHREVVEDLRVLGLLEY